MTIDTSCAPTTGSLAPVPLATAEAWETELAELTAHVEHATWRQLTLIRQLEPTGLWALHGATSYSGWLSWRLGLDPHAAREKIRVTRALGRLPRIDRAFSEARLSYSKVRALTRVADESNEGTLLEMALHTTAAHLESICRGIRRVVRDESGRVIAPAPIERWVRQREMDDGSVRLEAQLLPDEAALVSKAIELAREARSSEASAADASQAEPPLDPASALVRIAESFLARRGEETARTGDERSEIVIVLERDRLKDDPDALGARLEDGAHVPAGTLRRVACDCAVRAVTTDEQGSPLDVGRRTRVVPRRLRRALELRDRCCRFPGCAHRAWLDAHHLEHWLHGGATDLANLVLLCPAHHQLVHEGGFTIAFEREGREVVVRAPDGRVLPHHVPLPRVTGDPGHALRVSAGTSFHDETLLPWWDGAPPDLDACVEAGRPRMH